MKNFRYSNQLQKAIGAFAIAVFSLTTGCTKSNNDYTGTGSKGSGGPGTNEVWIQNMAFSPSSITVAAGTTIKWTNKDMVSHTVTSDNGTFDSGSLSNGATFSYTFSTTGTYPYHCAIHPSMTAKVIVN